MTKSRKTGFCWLALNLLACCLWFLRWCLRPDTFGGIQFALFVFNGVTVALILWVMGWTD